MGISRIASATLLLGCVLLPLADAFTSFKNPTTSSLLRLAAGKGFGQPSGGGGSNRSGGGKGFGGEKTYGDIAVIKDVIDTEAAMNEFFSSNELWHPLFRNLATSSSVPAMSFLGDTNAPATFDFDNAQAPWKRLAGIPTDDSDKQVLASVLDSMHANLVDIPVDEGTKEDDNDVHFLEEGRRMLAISRFHVLQGTKGGCMDSYDRLFCTCWSELMELRVKDEASTGSLIVVPEYELSDLRRFTDRNLLRPIQWLGMEADFEIVSMQIGKPAIRLLHKLQDMPDEPWKEPEEGETTEE